MWTDVFGLALYWDFQGYHCFLIELNYYSRVPTSSDSLFCKILKKPIIVQKINNTSIIWTCLYWDDSKKFAVFFHKTFMDCTVVGLSTTPDPLIISKSLQFRIFWSQSKALFVIRCMLSVGSGCKSLGD